MKYSAIQLMLINNRSIVKILFMFFLCSVLAAQDSLDVNNNVLNPPDLIKSRSHIIKDNSLIKVRPLRNWSLNMSVPKEGNEIVSSAFVIKKKRESFVDSDLFIIAVSSAIVFGTTAAYLKNESDKSYIKYTSTLHPKYLNKTNNLDVYSGIALGALQINFGYLIYKFLTD